MSVDAETIQTYNVAASRLADHFQQYNGETENTDIATAFSFAKHPVETVVEVGCGAGKDAPAIMAQARRYEGFDPSEAMLNLARTRIPTGYFIQADALSYHYPSHLSMVFAFASLLHLSKQDFAQACAAITTALKPGGVFCMTLKEAPAYTSLRQNDEFGTRLFYLYTSSLVTELVGDDMMLAHESHQIVGPKKKQWMSLIFVKK